MRFSVKVPVLSEQMTFMPPIVSQAAIFLTSALCFDILMMFIARETATMVGSPSGTAATISTMLVIKASETVSSEAAPFAIKEASWMRKTAAAVPVASSAILLPIFASFSCSGVAEDSAAESSPAILPNSVASPTAVTTARPPPPVAKQPE